MRISKNIVAIAFALFMVGCSYSSLRPEVVDRTDAQRMQTVIFATVVRLIESFYLAMETLERLQEQLLEVWQDLL